MSLQWTIIAGFLYLEIALVLLLVVPLVSPKQWHSIFRSRFLNVLRQRASFFFYMLMFVLVLFLMDAIREMRKYSNSEAGSDGHKHPHQLDLEMQVNMRLFRAQRNFYISGFALFLSLVIRRLTTLLSSLAAAQAESQAAMKQAASATRTAENLMDNALGDKVSGALEAQIEELKKELAAERRDKETLKKQAESLNKEYDRLSDDFIKLEKKTSVQSSGDKKDD